MLSHSAKWYCVLLMVAATGVGGMSVGSFVFLQASRNYGVSYVGEWIDSRHPPMTEYVATKDGDQVYFRHNDGKYMDFADPEPKRRKKLPTLLLLRKLKFKRVHQLLHKMQHIQI